MKKVSIITVTYNCKEDLSFTLKSLREQSFQDFEHIVVDGGSKDGTLELIQEQGPKIARWVSEKDRGIYDAMNKGIGLATGDYLQFLNAGDVFFSPQSLELAANEMQSGMNDVIYGEIILTDRRDQQVFHVKPLGFDLATLRRRGTASVNHQSFFIKRALAPQYSSQYQLKGELDWYIQVTKKHPHLKAQYIKQPLIRYRLGGAGNIHYLQNLKEWIQVVQKEFGFVQNLRNLPYYKNYLAYIKRVKKHF